MDLLKPRRYDGHVDEYKLQFSFNGAASCATLPSHAKLRCMCVTTGEQHITPWVLMLGKHAPKVPMILFNIVRSGDEIRRVNVEVGHQALPLVSDRLN